MSDVLARRLEVLGRQRMEAVFEGVPGGLAGVARKIAKRLEEGLDAEHVKVWQVDGVVIEDRARVDYTERRLAAELGAKLLDWMPNRLDVDVSGDVQFSIVGLDGERV